MFTKTAVSVGAIALLVAGGSAAWAAGSPSPSTTPTTATSPALGAKTSGSGKGAHARGGHHRDALRRAVHAQWVTVDKTGTSTTHDAIRGTVTAVSPTSITISAKDKTSETFSVAGSTKVHVRPATAAAKAAAKSARANKTATANQVPNGSIGQVKVGDRALVLGTGTTSLTAKRISDRGPATATPTR